MFTRRRQRDMSAWRHESGLRPRRKVSFGLFTRDAVGEAPGRTRSEKRSSGAAITDSGS